MSWSHGEGPEVHATGEAMLLMLTGRPVQRAELTGSGADDLWSRIRPNNGATPSGSRL